MTPSAKPKTEPLTGVEACARGAVEAGARLAVGYPGTPATPAMEYLLTRAPQEMRVEWAVNEKVALEIAAGHSWAGQRSFVAMKMSGLNVASDALLSVATSGTRGGLVLYVGDDPGMYYGMVEQDSRLWARLAKLPLVEAGTPQEAKDLTRAAFEVSEAAETPILVRGTSTTANTLAGVTLGSPQRDHRQSSVPFDLDRYTKAGAARCLRQHADTLRRLERAGQLLASWNSLTLSGSDLGIVATASVWGYVAENLGLFPEKPSHLRVAVLNPLPDAEILRLLEHCARVLVVEELEPYLEERVRALASTLPRPPTILGKREHLLPQVGDLDPDLVASALAALAGRETPAPPRQPEPPPPGPTWAPRQLTFCPGCPHRSTYFALQQAIRRAGFSPDEVVVAGDIGCTILGMNPPHRLCRTEVAMGSSIALAQGFTYAGIDRPVVAAIGDSTFFHAGIPALLNASAQRVNLTVLVLDNSYAAMTGYQPSPGNFRAEAGAVANPLSIEELARAARVRRVRKALPYFTRRLTRILSQALGSPGVNVVIAEAPCVARLPRRNVVPYRVRPERCTGLEGCAPSCLESVGCPAMDLDETTGRVAIDSARCLGCGLCAAACPQRAIRRNLKARRRAR
ncbi:MAG: thiamine pyrophosphate-dependent enzyme [Deferrisomatales bacterium]|nr:thiamine pyrophosphate-dependent enzyme [Deferrisomatales bacterium]